MKRITSKYLIVLGILSIVILGSQILMQKTIKDSKSDSRIINISGRQRMLSQKITKSSLKIQLAKSSKDFDKAISELIVASKIWSKSHQDLKSGTSDLHVAEMNADPEIKKFFSDIEPHFIAIKKAVDYLTKLRYDQLSDEEKTFAMVKQIAIHEPTFLSLMNKITFKYDELASAKNAKLSRWELQLMVLTFVLIFIEIFLIFRPMIVDSKIKDEKLSEINALLSDNQSFSSSQIESANGQIRKLRQLARSLKNKMAEKETEYALKITELMNKNIELTAKTENYKGQIKILREGAEVSN